MTTRRRYKQMASLKERLASFAREMREKATHLPPGEEREALLTKASQADTAAHVEDWINSAGLQPPK